MMMQATFDPPWDFTSIWMIDEGNDYPRLRTPLLPQGIAFVDASATGVGDGTSWVDAFNNPQDALSLASSGTFDQVWVANGTYLPDGGYTPSGGTHVPGSGNRAATFGLKCDLSIYGGFVGDETDLSERPPDPDPSLPNPATDSILSGDLGTLNDNSDNSYHVTSGSATNDTAVLDGFTITAGNANGGTVENCFGGGLQIESGSPTVGNCAFVGNNGGNPGVCGGGGGMSIRGASAPTISDCSFHQNAAPGTAPGGGMLVGPSTPVITRCTFVQNTAFQGGGMYTFDGSPTVTDSVFMSNTASGGEGSRGGGMMNTTNSTPQITGCLFAGNSAPESTFGGGGMANDVGSSPTLTDCTLINNSAAANGGGIHNDTGASPTLTNCTFIENTADFQGGGMYNRETSNPTLTGCTFIGNSATGHAGGGMFNSTSNPTLNRCTFVANTAAFFGGAMANDGSSPVVVNCLFSGNFSVNRGGAMDNFGSSPTIVNTVFLGNEVTFLGGGMYNGPGAPPSIPSTPELINCTLSGNVAGDLGGGILNDVNAGVTIRNSVLWDNSALQGMQIFEADRSLESTVTFSDVQGGFAGIGNIDADPLFVGGPEGAWTDAATYDAATGMTTLIDKSADFTANALVGKFLNPEISQFLQSLIVSNTTTEIVVWGDFTFAASAENGIPIYQINDYRLSPGSPAIDAANNAAVPVEITTDLDGNARFVDDASTPDCPQAPGTCGAAPIVDMGPYELQIVCAVQQDCDDQDVCTFDACTDGQCSHDLTVYGDADNTGVVDLDDILCVIAGFGNFDDCPTADFAPPCTGNGIIDLDDILAVIGAFGGTDPCCGQP